MDLLADYGRIITLARGFRLKAGEKAPPYSGYKMNVANIPSVTVRGGTLPPGVLECTEVVGGKAVITYSRRVNTSLQRVAIAHGVGHLLLDKGDEDRSCGRTFEHATAELVERRADMFAGELLAPLEDLHRHFKGDLFPRGLKVRQSWDDYCDHVASTFKVPPGFLRWRLYDLAKLRKTNWVA